MNTGGIVVHYTLMFSEVLIVLGMRPGFRTVLQTVLLAVALVIIMPQSFVQV